MVWLGKAGWKDWELKVFVLKGDWTFVTRNSVDFRGPIDRPGSKGQYADVLLYAGLICINGPVGMNADLQSELLEMALEEIGPGDELINGVLEVSLDDFEGEVDIVRYDLPPGTGSRGYGKGLGRVFTLGLNASIAISMMDPVVRGSSKTLRVVRDTRVREAED